MTYIDLKLQSWRIAKARPYLKSGARVLDIGSADGELFKQVKDLAGDSLGIDPTLKNDIRMAGRLLVAGFFPKDVPTVEPFDAITSLTTRRA